MKKFIIILFAYSLWPFVLYAQLPTQEWVASISGPYNDLFGPFLQVDKQGNSYVSGTHVINDSINIICVKYNTQGVQQWMALYKLPGYGYFIPTGLAIDSSGNAYVISGIALTIFTPRNMVIVKFNSSNGSIAWAKTYFGQYSQSSFFDIKIDRFNNIYVVGSSDSSHLIIRYNSNGDSVWVRKYHPPWLVAEYLRNCTIDDSLNIIFTGQRRFYYPPYGWYDSLLVAKYSSSGIMRWESVYAYNLLGSDIGNKITADQNGNSYIGGVTTITGNPIYLTLKYDRNGMRQWAKLYKAPGSGANDLSGIAFDRMNNALYVTGTAPVNNSRGMTTIKYNILSGDSVWVRRDTGVYAKANANDLIIDSLGNIYVTGSTYNVQVTMGGPLTIKYLPNSNVAWSANFEGPGRSITVKLDNSANVYICGPFQPDYRVIKYNQLSGIIKNSNNVPNKYFISSYPNPFNSQTEINFGVSYNSNVNITIFDILGREVEELVHENDLKAGQYKINWNAVNISSGIYFCKINSTYKVNNIIQNYINTIKLVYTK
jgi:hypothetical protein